MLTLAERPLLPHACQCAALPLLIVVTAPLVLAQTSETHPEREPPSETSFDAARRHFQRGHDQFNTAKIFQSENPTEHTASRGHYLQAAMSFAKAWRTGATSTEVLTNAANSFAFAGDLGQAVLFYRRALAVDPVNQVAQSGLESLRAELPIRRTASSAGGSLVRALFFWHDGLAFQTRRFLFVLLFPLSFFLFFVALWRRRPFLLLGVIVSIPAWALLGSLLIEATSDSLLRDGVIQIEVQGRRGDGDTYGPSHSRPFPPGTEVTVIATPGAMSATPTAGWVQIRLLDGSQAWVPSRAVDRVLPQTES